MRKYQIIPLALVKIELDMGMFTYRVNYGKKIWAPVYFWYIAGADKHILVDTAVESDFVRDFRGVPTEKMMSFEDALNVVGLKPDDIELVIQTHLHYDHCVNTFKCRNAKVMVQEDELKFALSPHPLMAKFYHGPLFKDLNFITVKGRYQVVDGIELIPVPGHSTGTQAVSVNTTQGKAIISGFCAIRENFEPPEEVREMWPVVPPGQHTNAIDAYDSVLLIKGLADILLPQHDPSFLGGKVIP